MFFLSTFAVGAPAEVDLNGEWAFALDPLGSGESNGWHKPEDGWDGSTPQKHSGWDRVTVPHTWNVDPRYPHDGKAWYRRSFECPSLAPNEIARLQFGSVFYKCRVWVNGTLVGSHEGGYTPFGLDVSQAVRPGAWNVLAVEVDNRWDTTTLPGSRLGTSPQAQLYPWWNWGGINRGVTLAVHRDVYVANAKIETTIDRAAGSAKVNCLARITNDGKGDQSVLLRATIHDSEGSVVATELSAAKATVAAGKSAEIDVVASLSKEQTRLWSVHSPAMYQLTVEIVDPDGVPKQAVHAWKSGFGLRSIETSGARLLLNGQPIRAAGANRVIDHPVFGGTEPAQLIAEDVDLLKRAHLVLSRLQHYPVSKEFLDEADRKGLLIILEAGNWQVSPSQMADPQMRAKFKQQMREMIESSWNHPSVIGYSVGNEYQSWVPEGVDWTRDMKAFVKSLDDTRFVMFAALATEAGKIREARKAGTFDPEQFSSHHSDVLSFNFYSSGDGAAKNIDVVHEAWPDRPIFVSEYGERVDQVKDEQHRIDHFRGFLKMLQTRPYVCGISYWSFNDYRSRYPGSNANGYRPWGLVMPDRTPRELYNVMTRELMPATIVREQERFTVTANSGFPSLPMGGCSLVALDAKGDAMELIRVPDLAPGGVWQGAFSTPVTERATAIVLRSASGHEQSRLDLVR